MAVESHLAPWGRRVLAYLLDLIWVLPGALLYGAGIHVVRNQVGTPAMRLLLIQLGISFAFAGWGFTRWYLGGKGASWGKQRIGLRLVGAQTGEPIDIVRAVLRDVAHLLDTLPAGIGFLWPLWDRERRTFADMTMDTRVVIA